VTDGARETRNIVIGADRGFGPYAGQVRVSVECDDSVTAGKLADEDLPLDVDNLDAVMAHPLTRLVVEKHFEECGPCSKLGPGAVGRLIDPRNN
jgi:hypothetical protein